MNCVRCADKQDLMLKPDQIDTAKFIYNGFSVCWECLQWIRDYERTHPLVWQPWEMNMRHEVTKKEEPNNAGEKTD